MTTPETITTEEATSRRWPVIVVGAGIAGCLLARQLAPLGVLLIDRKNHPRDKTCGGTLNARALEMLRRFDCHQLLDQLGATHTTGVEWLIGSQRYRLKTPPGRAISRRTLDAALLREARAAGVAWLPNVEASCSLMEGNERIVQCSTSAGQRLELSAGMIFACNGLHSSLGQPAGLTRTLERQKNQLIGCSILVPLDAIEAQRGCLTRMVLGEWGYCGFVTVEGDQWDVAAAIRLGHSVKRQPAQVAIERLAEAGVVHHLPAKGWIHTRPGISHQLRAVVTERLAFVGDAAGYVEPITGEGMAWALESAWIAAGCFSNGWSEEAGRRYADLWNEHVGRRRRLARLAGFVAARPWLAETSLRILHQSPRLQVLLTRNLFEADIPSP